LSGKTTGDGKHQEQRIVHFRGLVSRKALRFLVCLGLTVSMAAVLPLAGTGAASAAPVAAGRHHGGHGGGGGSGGRSPVNFRHRRQVSLTGTAGSVGLSGFELTVAGPRATLTATSTTLAVTVTSNTQYREPGQSSPGISGILSGDTVRVAGVRGGTDAVTALSVAVPRLTFTGTVGSPGPSGFVLTTRGGATVTVAVSASTKYMERGVNPAGLANVQSGNLVLVTGAQAGASNVDALLVVIGGAGLGSPRGHPHPGGGYGSGGHAGA
jgi:hypothetical protein